MGRPTAGDISEYEYIIMILKLNKSNQINSFLILQLVKRSHLVFIAILVFGQSPDPRVWHDTVRAPSAPGTEPQRVGYGVHGRCRCEPWGQDILHLSKRQTG